MPQEHVKSNKKQFKRLWVISIIILKSFSAVGQSDTLTEWILLNYIEVRDFPRINRTIDKITTEEKDKVVKNLISHLNNSKNFLCGNIIINRQNLKIYDSVYQTNILDMSKNWRTKKEIIAILIYDLFTGEVKDFSNRLIYNGDSHYSIVFEGREKKIVINKKRKIYCRHQLVDKEKNPEILNDLLLYYNKIKRANINFFEGFTLKLPNQTISVEKIDSSGEK